MRCAAKWQRAGDQPAAFKRGASAVRLGRPTCGLIAQEISTGGLARVRVAWLQQSRGQIRRARASVLVVAIVILGCPVAPAVGQTRDKSAVTPAGDAEVFNPDASRRLPETTPEATPSD